MSQSCSRCGLLHPRGTPCFSLDLPSTGTPDTLRPGTLLAGRYHIARIIHHGGMSVVYLADDRVQSQQVALKELRLPTGASPEEIREAEAWFARESYLLSSLRHPLIPAFYSVFREEGRSYIAQEYVQGENLEERVARHGPQDPRVVAAWGQAICELLSYLHQQQEPVVFRDLKPANILLRADGRLAVVDFGIARPYQPEQVGTVIGSPGYAPPEQYQGLATPQSDLYALGATLYRLLTGYDPEQGTPFTFPSVQALNPRVPLALAEAIARALRLAPAERFPTAGAMGSALRDAAALGGGIAGVFAQRGRQPGSHPWIQNVLPFVGALLLIPILGLWTFRSIQPPVQSDPYVDTSFAFSDTLQTVITTPFSPTSYQPPSVPQITPLRPITARCVWRHAPSFRTGQAIAMGPDGNLWATGANADQIVRVNPAGLITACALPVRHSFTPSLDGIVAGPDHAMWFTEGTGNWIGRLTADGRFSQFTLPALGSWPMGITRGPDGNLWFVESGAVGRLTPDGLLTTFPLPMPANNSMPDAQPLSITAGPDGNLWFTEQGANAIGRITPSGVITLFPRLASSAVPRDITSGPDGNLWFTEQGSDMITQGSDTIGRITPSGDVSEFSLPDAGGGQPSFLGPGNITAGPDGNLWFTEGLGNSIGRITPDGNSLPAFTLPLPSYGPSAITRGADGNLWFTGSSQDAVGSISPGGGFRFFASQN